MALRALLITQANCLRIADLNSDVLPSFETMDGNTFFVYDDEDETVHNEIITREEFDKRFSFDTSGRFGNRITAK